MTVGVVASSERVRALGDALTERSGRGGHRSRCGYDPGGGDDRHTGHKSLLLQVGMSAAEPLLGEPTGGQRSSAVGQDWEEREREAAFGKHPCLGRGDGERARGDPEGAEHRDE